LCQKIKITCNVGNLSAFFFSIAVDNSG